MGKQDTFLKGDILIFLQIYLMSSPLHFIRLFSKLVNLIGCQCHDKGFSSETLWGVNLKLGTHASDVSLYMNSVINCG